MRWFLVLFLSASWALGQQQITPEDFSNSQSRQFQKITESISVPCCQNGIPVAYHASSMAQEVRDKVEGWIREGKNESEILAALGELKLGPNQDLKILFTVPNQGIWGEMAWWVGPILIAMLLGIVTFLLRRAKRKVEPMSEADLVEAYRGYVDQQLEKS